MADTPNTSSEAGELYLDAAATEPVSPAVLEAMTPFLTDAYANPASVHQPGKTAARALDAARASFAAALGARPDDVIFTSGSTIGRLPVSFERYLLIFSRASPRTVRLS